MKTFKGSPSAPRAQRWLSSLFQVFAICMQLRFRKNTFLTFLMWRKTLLLKDIGLPGYLSQTLCAYEPTRNLRSSCEKLLKVPKRNTKTFGERSFTFLAPSVWNSLLSILRNSYNLPLFKSRPKILLPFRCLNPDSKLTCSWQLSASRMSAVFFPLL